MPVAVVADLELQPAVELDEHAAVLRLRVAGDVRHRLDRDAVGRDLDGGRQAADGRGRRRRARPGTRTPRPAARAHRRGRARRARAGAARRPAGGCPPTAERAASLTSLEGGVGRAGSPVAIRSVGRLQLQHHRRERRPEAVVQVAAQPAALLLARRHEPLARALQVGGELHRVRRDAGLAREPAEQQAVRGRELVALRPARSRARPRAPRRRPAAATAAPLSACPARRRARARRRPRAGSPRTARAACGSPSRPRSAAPRTGARARGQAAPELAHRGVRIVVLAVEQAVDGALQAAAQRAEQERHGDRRDERDRETLGRCPGSGPITSRRPT